jgi:hypothetical protein
MTIRADRVFSTPPTSAPISDAPTRRGFLAQAAGVAAGGSVLIGASIIAAPATASCGAPDQILAAIEAHKAAFHAVLPQIDIQNELERELMQLKRRGAGEVVWEDPRWIA